MLSPKKHLNLDISVLRLSALILAEIRRRGVIELDRLRATVVRRAGPDATINFMPAVSFLYLLGKLDYHAKNDTIEYLEI